MEITGGGQLITVQPQMATKPNHGGWRYVRADGQTQGTLSKPQKT